MNSSLLACGGDSFYSVSGCGGDHCRRRAFGVSDRMLFPDLVAWGDVGRTLGGGSCRAEVILGVWWPRYS